jgi:ribosome-associated protein
MLKNLIRTFSSRKEWYENAVFNATVSPTKTMDPEPLIKIQDEQVSQMVDLLREHRGKNITVLDISQKTNTANHMIICSGLSQKHIYSLANAARQYLRESYNQPKMDLLPAQLTIDGEDSDWMTLDAGSILVHCLSDEMRQKVDLEGLWNSMPILSEQMDKEALVESIEQSFAEHNSKPVIKVKQMNQDDFFKESDIYK